MLNLILLQAAASGTDYTQYIMLGVMAVVFYMFFIRPQQKKQKDQKKFTEEVKKGDQAVTIGGIHGKIVEITDSTITLDIDRGTKLVIEKSSISMELSKKANQA
ncbi:preprotein translocase subunit YajC [Reichenbachiella agarivorans]|uniref:Sec translocon accessory complex subunit YajC n=1 Tax=Reichenbachiella agarivorans TaxID=2979464 RepID=A0ABY6CTG0_9BACT|nr:preprotein translocase subunit YajC [Reichenbachiella agarivorans]UXP33807.1 preprotein translocase subunit YajC [Reichenbachiella agarivorans]